MSKSTDLANLFADWKRTCQEDPSFYNDGIINEREFENNKHGEKLLFIAKEANSTNSDSAHNNDFALEWNDPLRPPTYVFATRISEWTYGILNNFPKYLEAKNKIHFLRKIAFMNLKKSGGKGKTPPGTIHKYLSDDNNTTYILREIDIINPDVIILCTSFDRGARTIFGDELQWIESGYDIQFAKWKNKKIIDFYHPSSRNVGAASYSLLQNVFNRSALKDL